MGVPLVIIHFHGIFLTNQPAMGVTPMTLETPGGRQISTADLRFHLMGPDDAAQSVVLTEASETTWEGDTHVLRYIR